MFGIKVVSVIALVFGLILAAFAHPAHYEDQEEAASEHHGRVQIKVFRGPTEYNGHEKFAPYGYWVKQPADEEHH